MRSTAVVVTVVIVLAGCVVGAQQAAPAAQPQAAKAKMSAQAKIQQAMRAAPPDVAKNATIMDWPEKEGGQMKQLRAGTNGWMCMPSTPSQFGAAAGEDPMCLDKVFSDFLDAWTNKKEPKATGVGMGYMLRGDKGGSNTDPFATGPTSTNEWTVSGPHIMVVVPNPSQLDVYSADPHNGGPWVMWKGTKYAHLMVPVAPMPKAKAAAAPRTPANR